MNLKPYRDGLVRARELGGSIIRFFGLIRLDAIEFTFYRSVRARQDRTGRADGRTDRPTLQLVLAPGNYVTLFQEKKKEEIRFISFHLDRKIGLRAGSIAYSFDMPMFAQVDERREG